MSDERRRRPAALGDVLAGVLRESGLADRVEQAALLPEWGELVGPQIAAVTEPRSVSSDGTLWVAVRTHAWMNELSLLEPELLRKLATRPLRSPIRRIRWTLQR
jgi:predicted nucleic acid-binding Zn ribbon protein